MAHVRTTIAKAGTAALTVCAALCLVAPAQAATAKRPKVSATISACAGEALTIAATADPAGARAVKGSKLMLRFQALPLFHEARSTEWLDLGKAKKVNRLQSFDGLAADLWLGAVRWRFVRGRKTVASGISRTASGRAGGKKGKAGCVLPIGLRPKDVLPPFVALTPNDGAWHRAPLDLRIDAADDLSGVAEVYSRVDGGPVTSGRTLTLAGEGAHTVEFGARDVAGNRSATGVATVRVDAAAPSAPVIDFPPAVTGDTTPQVRWSASSDSGSGVRRYFVAVNASDGRLVATRDVPATGDASQSITLGELAAGNYEVQVFAFDGAEPDPFVTASSKRAFQVTNQPPGVASSDPADGEQVPYSGRNGNVIVTFDREMNAATVNSSTVTLTRNNSSAQPSYTVTCASPCVSATLDPAGALEGSYTLQVSSGVSSAEGTAITPYTATFGVNFYDNDFNSDCDGFGDSPWTCNGAVLVISNPSRSIGGNTYTSTGPAVAHMQSTKQLRVRFDVPTYSEGQSLDSWSAGVSLDGGACGGGISGSSASGPQSFTVNPGAASTVAPCFVLTLVGGSSGPSNTSFAVDNLVVDRVP